MFSLVAAGSEARKTDQPMVIAALAASAMLTMRAALIRSIEMSALTHQVRLL